jgi:hypothetical protein
MVDDTEKPPESQEIETPEPPPPVEEFPDKLSCNQCRRVFPTKSLRAKSNTLLTEAAIVCPRCRRKLRRMKLKDWYDHYVQGQEKDFVLDTHGFVHTDPAGAAREDAEPPPPQRPPQEGGRGRDRGRRFGRDRGRDQDRDPRRNQQKKSLLPQNVKAYRLPKRRRSRDR